MKRTRATWRSVSAGLLAAGVAAASWSAAGASALAATALSPPQLQVLEQKMEKLRVNSERFSEAARGYAIGSPDHVSSGQPESLISASFNGRTLGEASLSPAEGERFIGSRSRPSEIVIGSAVYRYEPGARSHARRPWVLYHAARGQAVDALLPFHGGQGELSAGGTGPFAGLLNLLDIAPGPVTFDGPASVRGEPVSELTAAVEPRLLLKGITKEDAAGIEKAAPIETLHLFLTASGLPIRVVSIVHSPYLQSTTTIEIMALNVHLHVTPPPAALTVSSARLH